MNPKTNYQTEEKNVRLPPSYFFFIFIVFFSNTGTWVQIVGEWWLVSDLSKDPFWTGLVGFAGGLPILCFSTLGGAIADRVERRRLLIMTQCLLMLSASILTLLTYFNIIRIWHVALLALFTGCVSAVNHPTYSGFIFDLVGRHVIAKAISLNGIQFHLSRMLGPMLAGILITAVGTSGCFLVNAISFLAVIPLLLWIPTRVEQDLSKSQNRSFISDLKELIPYVKRNEFLRISLFIIGITTVLLIPLSTMLSLYVREYLLLGPKELGLLFSSSAVGSIVSTILFARFSSHFLKTKYLWLGAYTGSIFLFLMSIQTQLWLSHVCIFMAGASLAFIVVVSQSMIQENVALEFRGRLMGLWGMLFHGMFPIGNIIVGTLAQWTSIPMAWSISALCLIFILSLAKCSEKIRR